jgi:predicted RNase H-like nuclease
VTAIGPASNGESILGVDAAWTETEPSGVALIQQASGGWRLVAVAPSYELFSQADSFGRYPADRPKGSKPSATAIIEMCVRLCGRQPNIVSIDMPLARHPIVGRRKADDAVSKAYGARKCATHTPSARRPGKISDDLRTEFEIASYPLRTTRPGGGGLIEVYPHPALVELFAAKERLPYKASKTTTYWKGLGKLDRRRKLLATWREIVEKLDQEIIGVAEKIPVPGDAASGWEMKAFEDMLDAIVCAWVGMRVFNDKARPFGNESAAIWIPDFLDDESHSFVAP